MSPARVGAHGGAFIGLIGPGVGLIGTRVGSARLLDTNMLVLVSQKISPTQASVCALVEYI